MSIGIKEWQEVRIKWTSTKTVREYSIPYLDQCWCIIYDIVQV